MVNILIISENTEVISKLKIICQKLRLSFHIRSSGNFNADNNIEELSPDIFFIDELAAEIKNINLLIRKIKAKLPNSRTIILTESLNSIEDYISDEIISSELPDKMLERIIYSQFKTKIQIDKLSIRNKDMAESLYRLNVLYNASSQFAGTLDIKELLTYMIEGLDKSLSFDLTATISFGFENEPVLIINSLYDVSEELMNALKLRAILNYKSLFSDKNIPFQIDDKNLKIIKNIKNQNEKLTFSIFHFDNMFAPIDLGDQFFGCIEIFRKRNFNSDDAAYFQTLVRQVSLPLKSAGLYKKIIEKNKELEKLERIKSNFISIVSHELRTPLTPIKNALSILSSGSCGALSDNAVKFIDMAKRNVSNLTSIINDILDINKIEAGMMSFNFNNIFIHTVIENVKNNFDGVAKEHDIVLITNEQDNLPEIYADPQRLEQILTNLVSNAIKFTPERKTITIKSQLLNADNILVNHFFNDEARQLEGDYVVVSVEDEGIGIKEENILKVFDMFTQIENSLTRKVGGTGLGLPIARQLIKAHKGIIWCSSLENKGSTFSFAIPVSTSNAKNISVQKELV